MSPYHLSAHGLCLDIPSGQNYPQVYLVLYNKEIVNSMFIVVC